VVPHQRRTTGGVYVIEQHARQLAAQLDLTLAVCAGELTPIPGVNVRSLAALDADSLPPAEVLVYPADLKQAEALLRLPADRGRAVMLFQGYGTPGSPVVLANLTAAREVVGVAHWLVDEARRTGVNCSYVPHGLDRELFAPGSPAARRPGRITMMTHRLDWKGLADGLAAIARVRAARPEVEVVVFGVEPVAGVDEFVASPTRTQVAGLLQTSTVHVVASWEEGFGLTGAEALACGAALATTDTKGSRDYALHGRTALVSPPRDPAALAAHVLELLGDPELRSRQVAAGQRHLEGVLPSWPEASRRLARALRVDSGGQRV
jgi:glycosyltransferase involved in cell wall biosynthesis